MSQKYRIQDIIITAILGGAFAGVLLVVSRMNFAIINTWRQAYALEMFVGVVTCVTSLVIGSFMHDRMHVRHRLSKKIFKVVLGLLYIVLLVIAMVLVTGKT